MNRKLIIFLAIALLAVSCSAKSKDKTKHSRESKESNETKESGESSHETSKENPRSTSMKTTVTEPVTSQETEQETSSHETETTTETVVDETTPETTTLEQPTTITEPEADLNLLCKGQLMSLRAYPGDCKRYAVCALGRLAGVYKCDLKNLNNIIGICNC